MNMQEDSSSGAASPAKKLSASASVRSVRVRCIGAANLKSGSGWFLRLRSLSRWLNTSTVHFASDPVWDESFVVDVLRHMELELWEHDPVEGDTLAGKKTVNLTLDVFPEADPPMGVETVRSFPIPRTTGTVQLGFTLLSPEEAAAAAAAAASASPAFEPPSSVKANKRGSIIGERRPAHRQSEQHSEASTSSMEQLRQVNEALVAMGKQPLTKAEAALILAGEKKRRETLVAPKPVGGAALTPQNDGSKGSQSPTKWMAKRTSVALRRDSSTAIYSQFKQQIYLKDKEIADKAKQVETLEQEVQNLKQALADQKGVVSSLEEKATGLANQLRTKSMQFLLVFEKFKEEKDALHAANARLREEMEEKEREHRAELERLGRDHEEKVRLAREEGSLSTTLAYSIKLENEKANHSRELARTKSDLAFEAEQLRKKTEAEKQALIHQYEGLLQKERDRAAEELRKKKEKAREKKQRLREERQQKEGVTQEMKRMEEKIQSDKRKWEEEREVARREQAERESQLERERRENERLVGRVDDLAERIALLEKKLQQAEKEKESLATDFAEQQEAARSVTEMQLRRVREEAASTRERLEVDMEALRLKLQHAGEREQANLERERREKLELKEAKVKLEGERLELAERLERLLSVEQELKEVRGKFEDAQRAVESERREKDRLLDEKRETERQAELLQSELRQLQEEAEAKALLASLPPSAPAPPPMAPAAAFRAPDNDSPDGSDSDVDDGGLLSAITRGVTLQPVRAQDIKPRRKAEGEVESISEAIALAIARRREMMMLAAPSTPRGPNQAGLEDDSPWDGDLYD